MARTSSHVPILVNNPRIELAHSNLNIIYKELSQGKVNDNETVFLPKSIANEFSWNIFVKQFDFFP